MEQSNDKGVSRRTVARGAAWAVPVVAMTAAAPTYAASQRCRFTVAFPGDTSQGPKVLIATSPSSTRQLRVTLTHSQSSGNATDMNTRLGVFGRGGTNINNDVMAGCGQTNQSMTDRFTPTAFVMNQTGFPLNGAGGSGCSSVMPAQTITLTVADSTGAPVTTMNASIRIQDISSAGQSPDAWTRYWDQVTFSDPATTDGIGRMATREEWPGTRLNATSGTVFYTSSSNAPTVLKNFESWHHDFDLVGGVPRTISYTSRGGMTGNQHISISAISFDAPC